MSKVIVITCDICGLNIPSEQPQIMTSGTNVVTKIVDEGSVATGEMVGTHASPADVHAYIAYDGNIDVCKACCKLIMK